METNELKKVNNRSQTKAPLNNIRLAQTLLSYVTCELGASMFQYRIPIICT